MSQPRRIGVRIGTIAALLGVAAGAVQWAFGDEIPEWTGNKLHPVQLGIITILLSLLALGAVRFLGGDAAVPPVRRVIATILIVACAGICFTTVGPLWYLPGPLLLLAAALVNARAGVSSTETEKQA